MLKEGVNHLNVAFALLLSPLRTAMNRSAHIHVLGSSQCVNITHRERTKNTNTHVHVHIPIVDRIMVERTNVRTIDRNVGKMCNGVYGVEYSCSMLLNALRSAIFKLNCF